VWSASNGKEKTPSAKYTHHGAREKVINPSSDGMRLTARQPRKIWNPTPTKRVKQETSNKYMGRNQQESPFGRHQQNK